MSDQKQPWNADAEIAVLAACMMGEVGPVATAMSMLKEDDFYNPRHKLLWNAMSELWGDAEEIDPITLSNAMRKAGTLEKMGGQEYIGFLVDAVPTAANVKYHAGIVLDHAERRAIIATATNAIESARSGKVKGRELAANLSGDLATVATGSGAKGFIDVRSVIMPVLQTIEDRGAGRIPPGVPTGYTAIDDHVGGFRGGELVVVCSVPAGGKTALAVNILLNAAGAGHVCGMVSAEMSNEELTERCLGNLGLVDTTILRKGKLSKEEWSRIGEAAEYLGKLPLHFDDAARPTIREIMARVKGLKAKHPDLSLVVVDFIQLIRGNGKNDEMMARMLTDITYDLKGLAKELGIAIIATCQVDASAVEKGETPKPRLHHIRWSQGIREGADMVAMLYRPRMYDPSAPDTMEAFFEKGRGVPPFEVVMRWVGKYMRVENDPNYRNARAA